MQQWQHGSIPIPRVTSRPLFSTFWAKILIILSETVSFSVPGVLDTTKWSFPIYKQLLNPLQTVFYQVNFFLFWFINESSIYLCKPSDVRRYTCVLNYVLSVKIFLRVCFRYWKNFGGDGLHAKPVC